MWLRRRQASTLSTEWLYLIVKQRGTLKVERARQLPGVFVVWIQWFTDSIAQWHRQDESRYLLDEEQAHQDVVASSPPSDPNAVSSDTDPEALVGDGDDDDTEDAFDEVQIPNGSQPTPVQGEHEGRNSAPPEGELNLNEVDWQDVNDEVEAAMAESDSEDETGSVGGSARSSVVSEDDYMDEDRNIERCAAGSSCDQAICINSESLLVDSQPQTPRHQRKRLRSVTPSESGSVADALRSPLQKRKKVAADRSGMSKLKMAMSATEIGGGAAEIETGDESNPSSPVHENGSQGSIEEESSDDGDGEEIDDDFLAREMEEELG